MSDLKAAILDAKYVDMISLGDFVSQDLGLPETDPDGLPVNDATEVAAAIFRWAAGAQIMRQRNASKTQEPDTQEPDTQESVAPEEPVTGVQDPLDTTATSVTNTNGS
ncbi:MAG: hypothetical protein MK160_12015 [Rhodobacteraceae bacterium]|nr:hypothetical protein [Paracoccaceae bacterium]